MTLGTSDIVVGLALALVLALGGLAYALVRLARATSQPEQAPESDRGAALIVEDGRVAAAGHEAETLLGPAEGRPAQEVIESFADGGRAEALAALAHLEATGEPVEMVVRDRAGRPYLLDGAPQGGQLRLTLRAADFLESAPGGNGAAAGSAHDGERAAETERALSGLLNAAPLLVWSRTPEGAISWSAGQLQTRFGTVEAAKAATLAAGRGGKAAGADGQGNPGGNARDAPERFRLELADAEGKGVVTLDVVEVPGPGDGSYGLAVDASAALEAERTLARFVRTMTDTFAHLNVGLAIFDRNRRLTLFNPALVDMWRADPAWLARRPSLREILDELRANRRVPETADFRAWRRRLTDLFEDTETADYEELWHLADGSDIRVLARPHPHGSLAFVFEDVTERIRLEQQFRHSIELRRATLDRLEEGLAVFGPDGLLQFVNTAFHEIWSTDEETMRPMMHVRDLIPLIGGFTVETEVWARLARFATSAESRQPWETRITMGTGRILNARAAALPDGATMVIFADVTDSERIALALRERNEALEAAEEMRTAVLDQISHRLRTPLHTIFGFGQLLVDPRFGQLTETQQGYADRLLESARELLAAVDDVTELSGLDTGPLRNEGANSALGDMLLLTARLLEKRATEAGVALKVTTPEDTLRPDCEARRLRQIVFGLATTAIGGARPESEVEIGARPAPDHAVELFVRVTVPVGPDSDEPKAECPSLPFLRRLVDRAGGRTEIGADRESGRITVNCRFPALAAPAPAGAPPAGGDPSHHE